LINTLKVKVKFTLQETMKAQMGITQPRCWGGVNATHRPLYPRKR